MTLLEAYADFGVPVIAVAMGFGALWMSRRRSRRRHAGRAAHSDIPQHSRPNPRSRDTQSSAARLLTSALAFLNMSCIGAVSCRLLR